MKYKLLAPSRRVISDLKKRSTFGLVFYLLVAMIIFFTGNYYERHRDFSTLFLVSIFAICLFRYIHLFTAKLTIDKFEKIDNFIFMASVLLTAFIWGMGFAKFMVQDGEYDARILMAICTTGLCSGGVVAFIPDIRLSVAFNFFMMVPASLLMLVNGINVSLAVSIFLFFVYLIFVANRGNNEYLQSLKTEALLLQRTKELETLSQVDSLTGLYNRRHFDQMFDFEWKLSGREDSSLTLIICDIDHFKRVNDNYGHLAGDEYLKKLAKLLLNVFKRETDIIARFGGEEFAILLPVTDIDFVHDMAEKVRGDVESCNLKYNGQIIKTTISLGVARTVPGQHLTKDAFFAKADEALYLAKSEGRNRVVMA